MRIRDAFLRPISRRRVLQGAGMGLAAAALPRRARAASAPPPQIVIVGGGFGGASLARAIKAIDPAAAVTLVTSDESYTACPFSNLVIAGMRDMMLQQFSYEALAARDITVAAGQAVAVDADKRRLRLADGMVLAYDRLALAPGIDLRWDALPGYTEQAAQTLPHAWQAGTQTLLLRAQLEAMDDGGTVMMTVPANPYRCPPGPYERASLIASYLKTRKPRAKLIVLDAKDTFSKQRLFQQAWAKLYGDRLEWVPLSSGGKVVEVDVATRTCITEFGRYQGTVVNVIPPQRAGAIAHSAGVADRTGWCPIDPATFESRLVPGIHVIGDAAIAGAMPKSAFAANAQAKVCAAAMVAALRGLTAPSPKLINTCYSFVDPDAAISIAGVYQPSNGQITEVPGSGGTSPLDADDEFRKREADYARQWFSTITAEAFG